MQNLLENPVIRDAVLRLDVEQYHRLCSSGIIPESTELLEGVVVEKMGKDRRRNNCRLPDVGHVFNVPGTMESCPTYFCRSPKSPLHSWTVAFLGEWFRRHLATGLMLRVEQPLTLGNSEPEPDLAVVAGSRDNFRLCHPSLCIARD